MHRSSALSMTRLEVGATPLGPDRRDQLLEVFVERVRLIAFERLPAVEFGIENKIRTVRRFERVPLELDKSQARNSAAHRREARLHVLRIWGTLCLFELRLQFPENDMTDHSAAPVDVRRSGSGSGIGSRLNPLALPIENICMPAEVLFHEGRNEVVAMVVAFVPPNS